MTYDPHSFVVRRPRHCASDNSQTRMWLEEVTSSSTLEREVTLCDFSRKGAKLNLSSPMTPGATVQLRVLNSEIKLTISLPAKILWQRRVEKGSWALGCAFEEEVPYEVIGELFLSGVLEMDSPSR